MTRPIVESSDHLLDPYAEADTPRALLESARLDLRYRLLGEQIPYGARVLEVGCGAGFLTNFLAIAHRTVLGIDDDVSRLRQAETYRSTHGLERAAFAVTSLTQPGVKAGFFDVVLATGALLRSSEPPRRTFARLARLVRPGGFVIALVPDRMGRPLVRLATGLGLGAPAPGQPSRGAGAGLSVQDTPEWLAACGLEFVNMIPSPEPGEPEEAGIQLFVPRDPGTAAGRFQSALAHVSRIVRDQGTFLVVGRRSGEGSSC